VVSFAATAALAQAPTFNRQDVLAAIDGFQLQTDTAIGSGIIVALAAIFPEEKTDLGLLNDQGAVLRGAPRGDEKSGKPGYKTVAPGSYTSAAIILLTDGRRTTGPSVIAAAQMAARRGVRVFTVGIGTTDEHTMDSEASPPYESLHEGMLKAIAHMTRGEYFYAGNVSDLNKIYRSLSARFVLDRKQTEITALFSAAAAFAALISALLSILWFDRLL
jgi:Ca-activated chloride channel family protein